MNGFTLAKIRSKYLIPHISWLQNTVTDMEKKAAILSRAELKKLDTYRKQLMECEEYDLLLKDMADKQISFDLDDGVTKNYSLFEGVVAEIK
ncbi:MAG: BREX-1 system adenine-specific DNA-methyltransferase PglX [Chitinophagaceae bacterium]|nr:BREX-1 system adenine-specific DNA-methyltransferase PglX [Chitinophagaceae bacterium]